MANIVYTYNSENGYYISTETIENGAPLPHGSFTFSDVIPLLAGEFAVFDGFSWNATTEIEPDPIAGAPEKIVVPITITSITDAITSDVVLGVCVAIENVDFTFVADIPLGLPADQTFLVPVRRVDTGRTIYVAAVISTLDELTVTLKLPTSGDWICGEAEINSDLSDEPFIFSFDGLKMKILQS